MFEYKINKYFLILILVVTQLTGCMVNPVTGKKNLSFHGEDWERNIGKTHYTPTQQSQGGNYTADPSVQAYINEVGQKLASVSDRKLSYEFVVINSSVPNAWALPGGKIAINRGLLVEMNSEAELASVLGHEVVHAAARHGAQAMAKGQLSQIAVIGVNMWKGSGFGQLAGIGAQLVNQKYGRKHELESDEYGMLYMSRAGYDPRAAIDLQKTFVRLSEGRQSDWLQGLFASHPPSPERVKRNIKTAKSLPEGGVMGERRYKEKLARLFKTKPAYEAYDEALKLANKDQYNKALSLLKKAKRIEPNEALFDLLIANINKETGKKRSAIKAYDRSIANNPNFFASRGYRGAMRYDIGDIRGAKSDLLKSDALLPGYPLTQYYLGKIAEDERNYNQAVKHFKSAASIKSEIGQKSYQQLLRLDLQQNPGNYIKARATRGSNGNLLVQLQNTTPQAIENIVVNIQVKDKSGRVKTIQRNLNGVLNANKSISVNSGFSSKDIVDARVKVVSARLN